MYSREISKITKQSLPRRGSVLLNQRDAFCFTTSAEKHQLKNYTPPPNKKTQTSCRDVVWDFSAQLFFIQLTMENFHKGRNTRGSAEFGKELF